MTVAGKDSQHNVVLARIVGKAEIKVLDSKPGSTYKFLFLNENEAFKFANEQPFGDTFDSDQDLENCCIEAVPGTAKLSYSKFLINTESPINVVIKAFELGVLTATKTVENVRFYKNKRTILTGNIYSPGTSTTGFNVTVNDKFDGDSVVVSF